MPVRHILLVSCIFIALPITSTAQPAKTPMAKDGPLGMKFVPLPKATTYLGWNGEKGSAKKTEIKQAFEIAVHTVTQGQWQEVMGKNPSFFARGGKGKDLVKSIKDDDLKHFPVELVSWDNTQEFIKKLNENEQGKGYLYRLPTEMEWEFACRGGATTVIECSFHFYFAKPTNNLSSVDGNFDGTKPFGKAAKGTMLGRTTKVGSYAPNKLGLYDMHGNVCQWTTTQEGSSRITRGGCFRFDGYGCRAGMRFKDVSGLQSPTHGFRLVRVPAM